MNGALVFALAVLCASARAQAPLPVPSGNVTQCGKAATSVLTRLKPRTWGAFEFNCEQGGHVVEFFAEQGSRIEREFSAFIAEHPGIFDNGPLELVDDGDREPALVRRRLGLPFHSGTLLTDVVGFEDGRSALRYMPKRFARIPADFPIVPKIASEAASASAVKEVRARRSSPSRLQDATLVIESARCRDGGRPTLAWRVRLKEGGSTVPVFCFVDAQSGRLCGSPACRSSTDPVR